jgi:glutaryl-CoA dehydrogenase (non-decarboxylating)
MFGYNNGQGNRKMHVELPEETKLMRELGRKFANHRLSTLPKEDYERGVTRRDVVEEMGELGFFGCLIPEEYGGTNSGFLSAVVIAEEVARASGSYGGCFMCQLAGPPLTILKYGTKEQKEKYIPGIISGKLITLFAATEPDAGSDVAAMKSAAVKKKDRYVINGVKTWISNATIADMGLFWVYTDREKRHRGISCFIVDMKNTSGISTNKIEKLGLRCLEVGEVALEDVEVPDENLLGKEGEGYGILMSTLSNTRLFAAARALGVGRACLEESLRYAKERVQFGKPIAEFQMIQSQLGDMFVEHEAAKLLVYQTASNKDRGIEDIAEVATAKYFACEAGVRAALTAMKIFSSYGFSLDYPVQRYVRDAMAFPITEGTSNIQKVIIARNLLKD